MVVDQNGKDVRLDGRYLWLGGGLQNMQRAGKNSNINNKIKKVKDDKKDEATMIILGWRFDSWLNT